MLSVFSNNRSNGALLIITMPLCVFEDINDVGFLFWTPYGSR